MGLLGAILILTGASLVALSGAFVNDALWLVGWLLTALGGGLLTRTILRPLRRRTLIAQAVSRHLTTLARRQRQLMIADPYGKDVLDPWIKETRYFVETVFLPSLNRAERRLFAGVDRKLTEEAVRSVIERRIARKSDGNSARFEAGMDPVAYEHFCADRLLAAGWRAKPTKPGGDQGVDVIAEASGRRLVLQCKLYDRSVGNAAVQEIIAGRQFEDAHHAVVVSNAAFTRSARHLAAKSDVVLLHHDELEAFGRSLLAGSV